MYDIITFGSATKDITIKPKNLTVLRYDKNSGSEEFCFPVGSKIEIDRVEFSAGGGGANSAATFALQGFKTAWCGMVGDDEAGLDIIKELKKLKIDTRFVFKTSEKPTNYSIVILNSLNERTILAYRGASEMLIKENIPWEKLKSKWIYVAPLSGKLCDTLEDIVDFAFENKIKVALNPGIAELSLPKEKLAEIFRKTDILILNREEAGFLTKTPARNEAEIFKKFDNIFKGIAVMTKGGEGVTVLCGNNLYSTEPLADRKIVDTTGAGDSFGAGFVTGYIRENGNIEKATQLGMANSSAGISKVGAKTGLLKKGEDFERVEVKIEKIQ